MDVAVCWCVTDAKCPHAISSRVVSLWDEVEEGIDEILKQFDRKTLKAYMKMDVDGNQKNALQENLRAMLGGIHRGVTAKGRDGIHFKGDDGTSNPAVVVGSINNKFMDVGPRPHSQQISSSKMRNDVAGIGYVHNAVSTDNNGYAHIRSRPNTVDGNNQNKRIRKDATNLMSTSHPNSKLPSISHHAWDLQAASHTKDDGIAKRFKMIGPECDDYSNNDTHSAVSESAATNLYAGIPGSSAVSIGLMRIADTIARKVLPWSAVQCPRAVEAIRDIRQNGMHAKHVEFIGGMTKQLEHKVLEFIEKKELEIDLWVEKELIAWQHAMGSEQKNQATFFYEDKSRINAKLALQDKLSKLRELNIALAIDEVERDATREQLVNFRRIAQQGVTGSTDLRILHASMDSALTRATAQSSVNAKDVVKRKEEAYEWLCCLADNAMTAAISEQCVQELFTLIDNENRRSLDSLHQALDAYTEQHNAILDAIAVFAGRIHQHASDYHRRETLVSRAFLQYVLGIISGEVKVHSTDQRKGAVQWEGKFAADRASKKNQMFLKAYQSSLQPLDRSVNELKERMNIQMELFKSKMQSTLNGRDNDCSKRKAVIQRRFSRHVNKACNSRRARLQSTFSMRTDDYELDNEAVTLLSNECASLRVEIDKLWMSFNLRERRMKEGASQRLLRLEKSALVIWNKHSHVATNVHKQEYDDWIKMYRRDRDLVTKKRYQDIFESFLIWRLPFGRKLRNFVSSTYAPLRKFVLSTCDFNALVPLEKNLEDLKVYAQQLAVSLQNSSKAIRAGISEYHALESDLSDVSFNDRKHALLEEWQDNLRVMDGLLVRRIGTLKDMECDLEETIRLSMMQQECEAVLFEQNTCAKIEEFWVDWRSKIAKLGDELKAARKDYDIATATGGGKGKAITRKDMEFDNLLEQNVGDTPIAVATAADSNSSNIPDSGASPQKAKSMSHADPEALTDIVRMRMLIDEIRTLVYKELVLKIVKSMEQQRKLVGVSLMGKTCIHPFYLSQILLTSADWFWEKVQMTQMCLGRINLSSSARATFCIGVTLTMLSNLSLISDIPSPGGVFVDYDEVVGYLNGYEIKRMCLIGMLLVVQQLENFGERLILSECVWSCSCCGVVPPTDFITSTLGTSVNLGVGTDFSFSVLDPLDIINSVLGYQEIIDDSDTGAIQDNGYDDADILHKFSLDVNQPISVMLSRISLLMPKTDILALVALLGRPNGYINLTTSKFTQVLMFLRKTTYIIIRCALWPPSREYTCIEDSLSKHVVVKSGKRRIGYASMNCMSPFETISDLVDWIVSIKGVPISVLQALMLISRAGTVDPWLEDPRQNCRGSRFVYELKELVEIYIYRDFLGNDVKLSSSLPLNLMDVLRPIDVMGSGKIPLELLRSYLQREDKELTNAQLSCIYWCLCKTRTNQLEQQLGEAQGDDSPTTPMRASSSMPGQSLQEPSMVQDDMSLDTYQQEDGSLEDGNSTVINTGEHTMSIKKNKIDAFFTGDVDDYLPAFASEVVQFIDAMPSLDTNVILGTPPVVITPAATHEIVSMAVKLDPSSRLPMPASVCMWVGAKVVAVSSIPALLLSNQVSDSGCPLIGVRDSTAAVCVQNVQFINEALLGELRLNIEIDLLIRFPLLCAQKCADEAYEQGSVEEVDLLNRRVVRADKLTLSWRNCMMTEWASCLYQSRASRYSERAVMVKDTIDVYHKQYGVLKAAILEERKALLGFYRQLEGELLVISGLEKEVISFHASFIDRSLRQMDGYLEGCIGIIRSVLVDFLTHCGQVKRTALYQVDAASKLMKTSMEASCTGLIVGYTGGYAQGYFDDLTVRKSTLLKTLNDMHGNLISRKEDCSAKKDAIEREVLNQISDSITVDRSRCKGLLESLSSDTLQIQQAISTTRSGYTYYQRDANARIVVKIEKAIRESRKLRSAAEQMPELEKPVLAEIRALLNKAKTACTTIVAAVKKNSVAQLKTIEPLRVPHRDKMISRIANVKKYWDECRLSLLPLVDAFEKDSQSLLATLKASETEDIGEFNDIETKKVGADYRKHRRALMYAFRDHMSSYDLGENAIFEKFNWDVRCAVLGIQKTWGDMMPAYLSKGIKDVDTVCKNAMTSISRDIVSHCTMVDGSYASDDILTGRFEVADLVCHTLLNCAKCVRELPARFIEEKHRQVLEIEDMGLDSKGDFTRPQVEAVMELMLAGIEIDLRFEEGYQSLTTSIESKCIDAIDELEDFVHRLGYSEHPSSILSCAESMRSKIQRRDEEVSSVLAASEAHLSADHSRMDVLLQSAEKDVEEWFVLTSQLIDNAFYNAEESYLSDLFPTPPSSPRIESIPEDEDRVARLKSLLLANTEQAQQDKLMEPQREAKRVSESVEEEEEEPRPRRPDESIELQEGWLECYTAEGFKYYFHPGRKESLWDLPKDLKKPLHPLDASKFIVTPRALLLGNVNVTPPMTPHRIEYATKFDLDPKVIMTNVVEEARALSHGAIDTAIEITNVIKSSAVNKIRPSAADVHKFKKVASPIPTPAQAMTSSLVNRRVDEEYDDFNPQEWLSMSFGSMAGADDNSIDYDLSSQKGRQLAEARFKEARENDFMLKEEDRCIEVEAVYESQLCSTFGKAIEQTISNAEGVTIEGVLRLKRLSLGLKQVSVIETLAEKGTSWDNLEVRIFETIAAEEEAQLTAQRLKTEAGRDRQRQIVEQSEDIEEMALFFRKAGLGKTTSRKAATEAVLKKMSTAKKLAKCWSRQQVMLESLGLDEDDCEEVELLLQKVVHGESIEHINNSSFFTPLESQQQQQQNLSQSFYSNTNNSLDNASIHTYDPIHDLGDNYSSSYSNYHSDGDNGNAAYYSSSSQQHELYKSFHGGWVECFADDGSTYYYNTRTGESSWQLPSDTVSDGSSVVASKHETETTAPIAASAVKAGMTSAAEVKIRPRTLPIATLPDVSYYSKEQGVARQIVLHNVQDQWQRAYSQCQFSLMEQKASHVKSKQEMFDKVSERVEVKLQTFVDEIKYMQKTLKKELNDVTAGERDLRRLLVDQSSSTIMAEKLTFILEGLERLKSMSNSRYDGSFKQMEKFYEDWLLLKSELVHVGAIYDESVDTNLDQIRLNAEHIVKAFVFEQLKFVTDTKREEMASLRVALKKQLCSDSVQAERSREKVRKKQTDLWLAREKKRKEMLLRHPELWGPELETQLDHAGYRKHDESIPGMKPEEEVVMSYMLRQLEMEEALRSDYDSIITASKTVSVSLQKDVLNFYDKEKDSFSEEGSWFRKHKDTIDRHNNALMVTLQRVRNKVTEGYNLSNARLEALEFDTEKAAEDELALVDSGSYGNRSISSSAGGAVYSDMNPYALYDMDESDEYQ